MLKLLFTGGGGAGNEAIHRFWHDRYELHFADATAGAFHPSLPAKRCHVIPMANQPDFVSALAKLCQVHAIDMIVPGVDEELPHIPALLAAAPGLDALLPPADFVSGMLDKLESANRLRQAGLEVPATHPLSDPAWREMAYPFIVKPRSGRGSRGVSLIHSPEEMTAYRSLSHLPDDALIAQAYAKGTEYTVFMSADREGNLTAVLPVKVEVKRGITLRAALELQPQVIAYCERLHAALRPSGVYNVQCILTEAGEVLPFEVNPRVSTTFCLSLAAGFDPVRIYRDGAAGERFQPGHLPTLSRFWYNHIQ